jgi:hypothetical protein
MAIYQGATLAPLSRAANAYIESWIAKNQRQTVVLREFPTCDGVVLEALGSNINQKSIDSLKRSNINFDPISFFMKTSEQIQPVIQALGARYSACTLDVDGRTKRPNYYSSRNRKLCDQAKSEGIACQWLSFNVPESNNVKNVEGDIKVDAWNAGMQISMSLLFQDYGKLIVDWDDDTNQALFKSSQYLILNYRDYLLVNKVRALLDSGHSAIVLLWGASHVKGIAAMLKEMGFRQSRLDDIKYTERSQAEKSNLILGNYTSADFPLSNHYDFQD